MRSVDMSTPIKNPYGKDFQPEPLTLESVCYTALAAGLEEDRMQTLQQRLEIAKLMDRVTKGGQVELSAADIVTLETRIAKAFTNAWILGRAVDLLEPTQQEAKP